MAQEWAKSFYNSAAWKKQRMYILKRDRYICTEPGCRRVASEVHHIRELTKENINDVNITLNELNLRSLCEECHKKITNNSNAKASETNVLERITFDENGFPVSETEIALQQTTR